MKDKSYILFSIGAAGVFFGFPNPFLHVPPLALLFPAALYLAGREASGVGRAFRRGLLCAAVGSSMALYWIAVPAQNVAGLPLPLAAFCPIGVGIYIGLFGGAFCALSFALKSLAFWRRVLILASFWYLLEFARNFVFSGFPWLSLASALAPWPAMLQGASLIGGYALSGIFALAAMLFAGAVESVAEARKNRAARNLEAESKKSFMSVRDLASALCKVGCGAALLAALLLFGLWNIERYDRLAEEREKVRPLKVAFIECNVDQNQKWDNHMQREILGKHIKLSEKALAEYKPDLLIWPETAMPFHYQNHPIFPPVIRAFAGERKTWLLFGAPGNEKKGKNDYYFYNRAYLVNPEGADVGYYEKEHLVPFGEYVPPWLDFEFAKGFLQGLGDFEPGKRVEPLRVNGLALGILICYETIFPELAQKRVAAGAEILVNISNDQWFGLTSAPRQHLQQAALRAVEQRRWLLRGTSSGISGVYDPVGRLTSRGGQMKVEAVYGLAFPEKEFTLFHGLFSFLPFIALAFNALLLFCGRRIQFGKQRI